MMRGALPVGGAFRIWTGVFTPFARLCRNQRSLLRLWPIVPDLETACGMPDRRIWLGCLALVVVLAVVARRITDLADPFVLVSPLSLFLVVLPMLLREAFWQIAGSRPTRALVMLRWPRSGNRADWAQKARARKQVRKLIAAASGDGASPCRAES